MSVRARRAGPDDDERASQLAGVHPETCACREERAERSAVDPVARRVPFIYWFYEPAVFVQMALTTSWFDRRPEWCLLAVLHVGLLVAVGWSRRRNPAGSRVPFFVADLVLAALWTGGITTTGLGSVGLITGVAIAMDISITSGARGYAVPLGRLALVAVAPHDAREALLVGVQFQVLVTTVGLLLRSYAKRRVRGVVADHEMRLAAERTVAWLAGESSVVIGVETDLDRLQRADALMDLAAGRGGEEEPGAASWRDALVGATRERAVYLGEVVSAWQGRRNRNPDLSGVVQVSVDAESRVALLTADQAGALAGALDAQGAVGHLNIRLEDPAGADELFKDRTLLVGRRRVVLRGLPRRGRPRVDLHVVLLAVTGAWIAGSMLEFNPVAPAVALPFSVAPILLAVRAHRRSKSGRTPSLTYLLAACANLAAFSAFAARSMVLPGEGPVELPYIAALEALSGLAAMYADTVFGRQRWWIAFGMAAVYSTMWLTPPDSISKGALAGQLLPPIALYVAARQILPGLRGATLQLSRRLALEEKRVLTAATEQGRQEAEDCIRHLAERARARLDRLRGGIDPRLAEEVGRRLDEIGIPSSVPMPGAMRIA